MFTNVDLVICCCALCNGDDIWMIKNLGWKTMSLNENLLLRLHPMKCLDLDDISGKLKLEGWLRIVFNF